MLDKRIAAAINAQYRDGWYMTSTKYCHGGDSENQLHFRSNDHPDSLVVVCHTKGCHKSKEGLNRARDNLRKAANVPAFKPSRRTTMKKPIPQILNGKPKSPIPPRTEKLPQQEQAQQIWNAGIASGDSGPSYNSPAGKWNYRFGAWPMIEKYPNSLRWLTPRLLDELEIRKRMNEKEDIAGAFVLNCHEWQGETQKVGLAAITSDGKAAKNAFVGKDKRVIGDKILIGKGVQAVGWLSHWPLSMEWDAPDLHICEGLKDGLALLSCLSVHDVLTRRRKAGMMTTRSAAWRFAKAGNLIVCVSWGKIRANIIKALQPNMWRNITLWPDGDAYEETHEMILKMGSHGLGDISVMQLNGAFDPAEYNRLFFNTVL